MKAGPMEWSWLTLLGPVALRKALLLVGILHQQTAGCVCRRQAMSRSGLSLCSHLIPAHVEQWIAVLK